MHVPREGVSLALASPVRLVQFEERVVLAQVGPARLVQLEERVVLAQVDPVQAVQRDVRVQAGLPVHGKRSAGPAHVGLAHLEDGVNHLEVNLGQPALCGEEVAPVLAAARLVAVRDLGRANRKALQKDGSPAPEPVLHKESKKVDPRRLVLLVGRGNGELRLVEIAGRVGLVGVDRDPLVQLVSQEDVVDLRPVRTAGRAVLEVEAALSVLYE